MNPNEHKLPDDFFQEKLEGFEAPYSEAAWEDMRNLLDKADRKRPIVLWFQKNKKTTLTLISITMITTTLISVFSLLNSYNGDPAAPANGYTPNAAAETNPSALSAIENSKTGISENTAAYNAQKSTRSGTEDKPKNKGQKTTGKKPNGTSSQEPIKPAAKAKNEDKQGNPEDTKTPTEKIANAEDATPQGPAAQSADATHDNVDATEPNKPEKLAANADKICDPKELELPISKIANIQYANNAVGDGKKNVESHFPADYTTFRGPFMGFHFTLQNPETPELMDSLRQNAGFNWQLMSSNLLKRSDFGAYMGFDFGMQFYGHGKNYGVVLNNTELDSGFTRLNTVSLDFFLRGHFEYAKFRIKPYVNAFAGPRLYATSQYTEAYHHKTNYDNSSSNNAATSGSLMYGAGVGARYALSKHVSLDFRYEFMQGTETRLVDLNQSSFSGISNFNLSKINVTPAYSQWKFGVLFDLWDGETEKDYEPNKNNEVTEVTEYYYYDSSSQQYIKVNCKCKQTPVSDTTGSQAQNRPTPFEPVPTTTTPGKTRKSGWIPSGGSSGGSSGGRGSFPGIKPGGGGGTIRN